MYKTHQKLLIKLHMCVEHALVLCNNNLKSLYDEILVNIKYLQVKDTPKLLNKLHMRLLMPQVISILFIQLIYHCLSFII
jgi:hypothetical protein